MTALVHSQHNDDETADLREDRDRFVAFAFAAAHVFFEVDPALDVTHATGALQWLSGTRDDVFTGRNVGDFVVRDDRRLLKAACSLAQRDGQFRPITLRFRQIDGRIVKTVASGACLPVKDNHIYIALRSYTVGRSLDAMAELHRDAAGHITDELAFARVVAGAGAAARQSGEPLSMSLFDLGGLNALRERLSPLDAADMAAEIEAHLQSCSIDGVPVAQVGEESFGLLHHQDLNVEGLAAQIDQATAERVPAASRISVRSATIGVTETNLNENDVAKAVVYAISQFTERNITFTIRELDAAYKEMLGDTQARFAALKQTIGQSAFDLVYQPIVGLTSHEVHHHEALVRFREQGDQSPFDLITFAEQVDMIAPLDLAICQKAINTIKSTARGGRQISLAVNLSGRSLETPAFLDRLQDLLREAGPLGRQLMFEITESATIRDLEAANNFLLSLQTMGHEVCLDDFGAGASAFHYLRALSVDYAKIDGSYVLESRSDADARSFIRSMTELCRDLGIETIGEMVEDETAARTLTDLGVGYGQGYLFGRPLPAI